MPETLNSEKVEHIFIDCLFKDNEPKDKYVVSEGIMSTVGFHPERLEEHRVKIEEMLNELPDSFHQKIGGGMSFLNACMNKHGKQWGEHSNMEQLFQLGQAIGRVKCLMPRNMWSVMPGGIPYYVVLTEPLPVVITSDNT